MNFCWFGFESEEESLTLGVTKESKECMGHICFSYVYTYIHTYEGHLESKERFAIQRYLLIIGKKKNMQVL